jgi:YYY domain-containing protein
MLFLPFYLHFHTLAHGFGAVTTRSNVGQFAQVFGLFLVCVSMLLGSLAILLQPIEEEASVDLPAKLASERGSVALRQGLNSDLAVAVLAALLLALGAVLNAFVLAVALVGGGGAIFLLERVLNTDEPNSSDTMALLLVALGCLIVAFTEVGYLRDSFDGGVDYRMNTVFKFYYQAWCLLGLAAAYGVWRGLDITRRFFSRAVVAGMVVAVAVGVAGSAVYTVLAPTSLSQPYPDVGLDGMSWIRSTHPGDFAAIAWLQRHGDEQSVVLEAVGGDYTYAGRISSFSGLPTVMGWAGHEDQWRPRDGTVGRRAADVQTIYTTSNEATARTLLRHYGVRYVVVGDEERAVYGQNAPGLDKFGHFMNLVFQDAGTAIYTW